MRTSSLPLFPSPTAMVSQQHIRWGASPKAVKTTWPKIKIKKKKKEGKLVSGKGNTDVYLTGPFVE